jgi:hypothetical protein
VGQKELTDGVIKEPQVSSFVSEVLPALFDSHTKTRAIDLISLLMDTVHKLRCRNSAIGNSLPSHRRSCLARVHDNALTDGISNQINYYPSVIGAP